MELKLSNIHKIVIIGSGSLGARIALQSALSGFDVMIYNHRDRSFPKAQQTQEQILHTLMNDGKLTMEEANAAKLKIHWTTNAEEAAHDADFINESVTEDLRIKQQVWQTFGDLCPVHTVFTTNTSYILPSLLAESTGRPELFCAFHFYDVFRANVVDIMPHGRTEPWVITLLRDLGKKLNQVPIIMKKEYSGYVFNNMVMAFMTSAGYLYSQGIATIHDIDKSWMLNLKTPFGPFGMSTANSPA